MNKYAITCRGVRGRYVNDIAPVLFPVPVVNVGRFVVGVTLLVLGEVALRAAVLSLARPQKERHLCR